MKKSKVKSEEEPPLKSNTLFPVAGIGASAGGLDAFKKLIGAIPQNSGIAYVLVQHLNPNHESMLPGLLQKVTTLPVLEITDKIKILPDHIYIIPSNTMLIANDGKLELSPRKEKKNGLNLPIDLFFTSLAAVNQSQAIGIVLSGTAHDGTQGLKAIKEQGGITFAQDEESAAYGGMPHSAAQAGVVDFILPPEKIPQKIIELVKITAGNGGDGNFLQQTDEDAFKQILSVLHLRKGTDFTHYKQSTIRRRILRRMALSQKEEPIAYLTLLRENKSEQDVLYQDLLIPVTSFFRDVKSLDSFKENVLPAIHKDKSDGEPIRVWVAGCSTGEEAYSIAICILEFFEEHSLPVKEGRSRSVQIFATDASEHAIAKARSGLYSKSEVDQLTPHRLNEFFTKHKGNYQVKKEIRDHCLFAVHNFLKDPPFGKIDFISCRNVLIYMEPFLQKQVLTTFHYSLNPGGFLLLGKSETISSAANLFSSDSKHDKIFSRINVPGKFIHVASLRTEQNLQTLNVNPKYTETSGRHDFQKTADDLILNLYAPSGVVVNETMDIVHFRGNTSNYLEQAEGQPTHNLLKMARPGLAFELRNLLHKAKKEKAVVTKESIPVQFNDRLHKISIEAIPLPNTIETHYLILFHDENVKSQKTDARSGKPKIKTSPAAKELQTEQLERELAQAREDMRSITEDQEAANEELQSANEELLSSNEELQTLNEELESGKEELQSTNEELTVVNQELISTNELLINARDYAENIISTIRQPLLVLDKSLRVKSANNAFFKTFGSSEQDIEGKLIYTLGDHQWNIPELRRLLEDILPLQYSFQDYKVKHSFQSFGERTMLLNGRELKIKTGDERLILLAIEDITEKEEAIKKIEERENELKNKTDQIIEKNTELQKMNKELEAFNYVSSHDLQEPLRKIQMFAGRIMDKESLNLSDKGKDMFQRMQEASQRMQTLIQDLLTFSRTNTAERKFEIVNLNELIDELKFEFKEIIEEKHATIEVSDLCDARVIRFQFRQLMHNLISNGLKFSKPGIPPHIIIKNKIAKGIDLDNPKLSPKKKYCHISVTDNGIGFEKEFSEKIFEVFQKLHGKDEYAGTGIGLAIVKKIVENHEGLIIAQSELGNGARFDIYIPV